MKKDLAHYHLKHAFPVFLFPVLFLFVGPFSLSAQSAVQLQGVVKDSISAPLSDCSVLFYAVGDTLPLLGVSTDRAGRYAMSVDTGTYRMQVSHVGYETFVRDLHLDKVGSTTVDVMLMPSSRQLTEVVITEEGGTPVGVDRDKLIYKIPSRVKRSAADSYMALSSIPSLQVNPFDRSVKLFGSGSTVVMVNGVRRDRDYLQLIRPEQIDRVEITRYPSMRYALQGIDAIVNIVTKEPVKGYHGYVVLQQDPLLQYGYQGGSFMYVADKWTLSLNASNFYFDEKGGHSTLRRDRMVDNGWARLERVTSAHAPFRMVQPKALLNVEYAHSKHSFTILSLDYGYETMRQRNSYEVTEVDAHLSDAMHYSSLQKTQNDDRQGKMALYHQTSWAEKHTLSIDASYRLGESDDESFYTEYGNVPIPFINGQRIDAVSSTLDAQANMEHRWKGLTMEEGYRHYVHNLDYANCLNARHYEVQYRDSRHDFYLNLKGNITKKLFGQVGLNMELNRWKVGDNSRLYADLLPSLTLYYGLKKNNRLTLNYLRSKQLPGFTLLDPTPTTVDSMRVYKGNPGLTPAYTNNLSLIYEMPQRKIYLSLALHYKWGALFSSLSEMNENGVNVITYSKQGKRKTPSLDVNVSGQLFSWCRLGLFGMIGYQINEDRQISQFDKNLWTSYVRLSGNFNYKRFAAQVQIPICYEQQTYTGYAKSLSESGINASYRLGDSWVLLMDLRYLLPVKYYQYTALPDYREYYSRTQGRFMRLTVGFRYHFSKGQQASYKSQKRKKYDEATESDVKKF